MIKYIILTRKPLRDLKIRSNLKHHIVDYVRHSIKHSLLPLTELKIVGFSARSVWKWEISQYILFHVNPCCCGLIVIYWKHLLAQGDNTVHQASCRIATSNSCIESTPSHRGKACLV